MKETNKKTTEFISPPKLKLWELLAYFIIYSIAGYIIETLFALIRYGVLEVDNVFYMVHFVAFTE